MRRATLLLVLSAFASALPGCATDEQVNPVSTAQVEVDAGLDAPEPPLPDAGPWKRSVFLRNPYGGPSGNLLADGDFERSTVGQPGAQLGWRGFSENGSGLAEVKTETGGLCRSGLRCAIFEPNTVHLLKGTAANDAGMIASVWAKLPVGSLCKLVFVALIRSDDFVVHTKLASDKATDAEGWCHYTTRISRKSDSVSIYLQNDLKAGTVALIDSAVLGPDDGTIHPKSAEFWAPPADLVARLETIRETMARTAPPPRKAPAVFTP